MLFNATIQASLPASERLKNENQFMDIVLQNSGIYFLIFVRISAFVAVTPFYGHRSMPQQAKLALALMLTLVLFPALSGQTATANSLFQFALLAFREVLVGLVLGFAAKFIFFAVRIAGQVLSFLFGFSIVNSFNPDAGEPMSLIAQLKWLVAMVIFLVLDGHFLLI
ncbi:MAG: hypothetical protein D6814_10680, partial [Calditrichaeota bacterium]